MIWGKDPRHLGTISDEKGYLYRSTHLGGDQEEVLSIEKFGGYKIDVIEIMEERERLALTNKVKEEKHLEIYGRWREDIGMKTYLRGSMDHAKKLKLRFRVEIWT